jgi:endonuclease-3
LSVHGSVAAPTTAPVTAPMAAPAAGFPVAAPITAPPAAPIMLPDNARSPGFVPQPASAMAEASTPPISSLFRGIVVSVICPHHNGQGTAIVPSRELPAVWRFRGGINGMARSFSKSEAAAFFARLEKVLPDPKTELEHVNPYTLLVAVVLSAQATDKGVNRASEKLFKRADTPEKMVKLGVAGLTTYIRTIGLYRGKAKNVIALSRLLIEKHGGRVPRDREALEELPGVGRKTANVVLNVAFGEKTIAVDTHIFRVANRTGLAPGKNPREVEDRLMKIVPDEYALHAHHWLILHGRYTCVARKPHCPECVVRDLCRYKDKTR